MLYFLGSCGQNAECYVINHNPVCKCLVDFTGDPFVGCEYNFNDNHNNNNDEKFYFIIMNAFM